MIVVAGEALIDLLVRPDGSRVAVPGGGPFNAARTIARLGGAVAFLGRLSTDDYGRVLREALAGDGVDLSMAESTDAPTTLAVAELDDLGAATYRFQTADTAAAALTGEAVAAALATQPRAFHLGSLGLALEPIATALLTGIASTGPDTLVMVDPNCRPAVIRDRAAYVDRLESIMVRTDVVKASTDDLAYLVPDRSVAMAARALLERGPSVVLVTDGPRAVLVVTRAGVVQHPVPEVTVVDTVGAGDAFGGAFLARWIEGGADRAELADPALLHAAVTFAIEVAALTCQRSGADPPRRIELRSPAAEGNG